MLNLKSLFGIAFLWLLLAQQVFPIERNFGVGSREKALAMAVISQAGAFAVFHNQAFLADCKSLSFGMDYCQPYSVKGFSEKALAITLPTKSAVFGLSLDQTGIPGYAENSYGFAMAKALGKRTSAGIKFDYFTIDFPENGTQKGILVLEGGIGFRPTENISFGLHCYNPFKAKIESLYCVTEIPTTIRAGTSFKIDEELIFATELAYLSNNPLNFRMGLEYQIADGFFLRGGLSGRPINHSAGIGYNRSFFTIGFAIVHHETLGYTPSFSFILNFQK